MKSLILQTFYPIFYPMDNTPMTDNDMKVLLGIWIFLNIIWLISFMVSFIRFLKNKYNGISTYDYADFRNYDIGVPLILDFIMIGLWIIFIIAIGGISISKLL